MPRAWRTVRAGGHRRSAIDELTLRENSRIKKGIADGQARNHQNPGGLISLSSRAAVTSSPVRQRSLRTRRCDPHLQPRLRRVGRRLLAIASSPPRCLTESFTTPSHSDRRIKLSPATTCGTDARARAFQTPHHSTRFLATTKITGTATEKWSRIPATHVGITGEFYFGTLRKFPAA